MSKHSRDLVDENDYKPNNNWVLLVVVGLLLVVIAGFLILFK